MLEEKEKQGVNVEVLTIGNLQTALKHLHTLNPIDDHKNLEPSQLIIVDDAYLLFAGIEHDTWKAIKTMSQPLVKSWRCLLDCDIKKVTNSLVTFLILPIEIFF